ncbi:uncharacterized protein C8A04DRAFT_38582 [Dichotomopilus funicola]|uniref:Voltage-gated hydrogen channel 1 n=1 Tax=Dichotomopilus funicola TaxID=1934379 RepID=A0AAN6UZL7_9PEZI|nr:hypothetical protein C8A04DRAFT_38582 [Dichotomopilus funicola]
MPSSSSALSRPLLAPHPEVEDDGQHERQQDHDPSPWSSPSPPESAHARLRQQARELLSTRAKHYFILTLVSLDVVAILVDLFATLLACDLRKGGGQVDDPQEGVPGWVGGTREVLHPLALVFSCAFVGELGVTVWAFGWGYFRDWFHCFDAFVILVSFGVDVATRGIVEDIASIVIVLRLWRLVKIIEEVSVGAAEGMEEIEARVVELERENEELRKEIEEGKRR